MVSRGPLPRNCWEELLDQFRFADPTSTIDHDHGSLVPGVDCLEPLPIGLTPNEMWVFANGIVLHTEDITADSKEIKAYPP
jgi:hypothetical protein